MDFRVNLLPWYPKQCTCVHLSGADPQLFRLSEHLGPKRPEHRAPLLAIGILGSSPPLTFFPSSFSFFLFLPAMGLVGFLVPQLGIEPGPSAVSLQSPNHWACRECPRHFSRGPLSGSTVETASVSRVKTLTLPSQMPSV